MKAKASDSDSEDGDDEDNMRMRAKTALSWTGRCVAHKLKHVKRYKEIKHELKSNGAKNLQIYQHALTQLWDSLTDEEKTECEKVARSLNEGGALKPDEQRM